MWKRSSDFSVKSIFGRKIWIECTEKLTFDCWGSEDSIVRNNYNQLNQNQALKVDLLNFVINFGFDKVCWVSTEYWLSLCSQSPLNLHHFCLTRFQIEGWLELFGTPSVDVLHRSDCTWLCCLLSQFCEKFCSFQGNHIISDKQFNQSSKFDWRLRKKKRVLVP